MSEIYRLILKQEINIKRSDKLQVLQYDNSGLTLGNMVLSANSILGNRYPYYYPSFQINFGNLPKAFFYDYLPGGRNLNIIEKLNEYFVPIFCETEINIETETTKWQLGTEDKNESRLGYSMVI